MKNNILLKWLWYRLPLWILLLIFSPWLWFVYNLTMWAFFVFTFTFPLFCILEENKEDRKELIELTKHLYFGVFIMIFQYILYNKSSEFNEFRGELN